MFDEMDRLRSSLELGQLLLHYFELGQEDRQSWQDRLDELENVPRREVVRLHGELLAYGWLEQNTGLTPILAAGRHSACYRITSAGQKAIKQLRKEETAEPAEQSSLAE